MFEQDQKEEILHIFREIEASPAINQRALSAKLGISLGKTNYLLKELVKKGLIKVRNFTDNPGKLRKIGYLLTPEGLEHRVKLAQHFLKRKEEEYNRIKNEVEQLVNNGSQETTNLNRG
jgi:EPS-associated MarR family transcriptional regulator